MQELLRLLGQRHVVAKAAILRQVNQQIDVAIRALFATGDRAEQAQIRGAMPGGNLPYSVPLLI